MAKMTCQVCGRRFDSANLVNHHVVPVEVTTDAGIPESQILQLCADCHHEAHTWYTAKIRRREYDTQTKRFRQKSYLEMVKEYQTAFSSFAKYKKAKL